MALMRQLLRTLAETAVFQPPAGYTFPDTWTPDDWALFLGYARHHRVTPLLALHVQSGVLQGAPASPVGLLQKDLHQTRLRHAAAIWQLEELEDAFRAEHIEMAPLKGPRLAEEAYPQAGLRPFDDLDLLIEPDSQAASQRVLNRLGYRPLPGQLPSWIVRRYHFHTQWLRRGTQHCVELHWRPADQRTLPSPREPISYLTELKENPAALPIYLAIHLAKHSLVPAMSFPGRFDPLLPLHPACGIRLVWLLDIVGLLAARRIENEALGETAIRWNAIPAWEAAARLLRGNLSDSSAPLPRFSLRARLLRSIERKLDHAAQPIVEPSWWFRSHARIGFRPVRLLDLWPERTP